MKLFVASRPAEPLDSQLENIVAITSVISTDEIRKGEGEDEDQCKVLVSSAKLWNSGTPERW